MEQDILVRMQNSRLYRFFECLFKMVLVNLSMILLSLCGLVVFGFFPAIFAAAAYFNDIFECKEGKILPSMFGYFKRYFLIGNLLMVITVPAVGLIFFMIYGQELNTFMYLLLYCWIIVSMLLYWYLPAVSVLYPNFRMKKKVLFSLVVSGNKWLLTALFLFMNLGWMYVVLLMPQIMMFIMFSAPVWFCTWRIKKTLKPDSFFDPTKVDDMEKLEENAAKY